MRTLPAELLNLIVVFQPLFTKASWEHAKALLLGALLLSWQTRGHGLSARGKMAPALDGRRAAITNSDRLRLPFDSIVSIPDKSNKAS